MESPDHWIEDWLSSRAESEKTRIEYRRAIEQFSKFCESRGKQFSQVVELWRSAHYLGAREEQIFVDQWQDMIRAYATRIKSRYAPLSQKVFLTVPKSFFRFWKIPLNVDLPRHSSVIYHNQDLQKEQIRMILSRASQRDRTIFLVIAESGLRADTMVNLKYWQIKEDFEKGIIPMRILTPVSTLKDRVGDRWSFIGEDGVKALSEYLKPRLQLKAEDYVFASEKPSRVKGEQFTVASLSTIFRRITQHLRMEKASPFGKPEHYRMHGLRKYFRNSMAAPYSFIQFWMEHSLKAGSDEHYIFRDPEEHRKRYAQGYEQLRLLEPVTPVQLKDINDQLRRKDQQIQELRAQNEKLSERIDKLAEPLKMFQGTQRLDIKMKDLSQEQENTPLGQILQFLRVKAAKDLNDEIQKLKEKEKAKS